MEQHSKDIQMLRYMLSVLMVKQSSPALNGSEQGRCREGITALKTAIEIMELQVYA